MNESTAYTIGTIIGNTRDTLDDEVYKDSIDILLMGLNLNYFSKDLVQGYANCFNISQKDAMTQIRKIKNLDNSIMNINSESERLSDSEILFIKEIRQK